jgi:hypothetical protein
VVLDFDWSFVWFLVVGFGFFWGCVDQKKLSCDIVLWKVATFRLGFLCFELLFWFRVRIFFRVATFWLV